MNTKLKVGAGIVLLLALIPAVDGYLLKQTFTDRLAAWHETHIKLTLIEYHEGWLSSDAKILVEAAAMNAGSSSQAIELDQHISHGPIAFNPLTQHWEVVQGIIHTYLHTSRRSEESDQINKEYSIVTVANFNGVDTTQFSISPMNQDIPSMGTFSWQGLNGNLIAQMSDKGLKHIQSDINVGAVAAQSPEGTLVTKDISIKYELSPNANGLSNSSYSYVAPQVSITSPRGNVNVANFKLNDVLNVTGNNCNNDLQLSFDQFSVSDNSLGQSNFHLAFKNVNAHELHTLMKIGLHDQSIAPQDYDKYFSHVLGLFTSATDVEFNALVDSSDGHIITDGQISWPQGVKSMQDIVTNADAKINIRIAVGMVNKLIDALAQKQQASMDSMRTSAPVVNVQPSEDSLSAQIDAWSTDGKIEADTSENLKDLVQAHLSAADFAKNVDGFVQRNELSTDLAAQLKVSYNRVVENKGNPHPVTAMTQPAQSVSPEDQMKQQLAGYVKAGYVTLDKEDYVTAITVEQGVVKANGVVVK